jgi:hypothetical protein
MKDGTPPFWHEKAARMVGKHVLVGKTYVRGNAVLDQVQFHGVIEEADEDDGFALRRSDTGEIEWLPPDLRAFEQAPPGEYRLRSTGEVIVDPDILSTWIVEGENDSGRRLRLVKGGR